MTLIVSPDLDALFLKLQPFIQSIVPPGTPVMRAPINRVAQPSVDHVIMTPLFQKRLRTNVTAYDDPFPLAGSALAEQGTEVHVQLDFYGSKASDWAVMCETMFRSEYAVDALAPVAAPLYADEARMIPLVTGEEQFLERYAVTAAFQYNPVTAIPQEFADVVEVTLAEVDVRFPP